MHTLTQTLRILRVSLRALARNKMRTFLTCLGIIIGVGAVIAMVSIGAGAKQAVEDRFSSMGTNLLFVSLRKTVPQRRSMATCVPERIYRSCEYK